jgi:branched-chain amino acid transport system permease protein
MGLLVNIIQVVISGLLMGAIYSLLAVGLTLVFGVMRIVNYCHGTFLMIGSYTTFWVFSQYKINVLWSLPISFTILFALGALIQRTFQNVFKSSPMHMQLLLTVSLMLIMESIVLLIWKPDLRGIENVGIMGKTLIFGDIIISVARLVAFLFAALLNIGFFLMFKKTKIGKAIRAASDHIAGAWLMGINVNYIYIISFGISSACAGLAGSLIVPFSTISPNIGNVYLLKAFIIIILGGMGSFTGALVGGLIVGVTEALGAVFLPGTTGEILIYVVFVIFLIVKPEGLFKA